jgi:hypothetical protein
MEIEGTTSPVEGEDNAAATLPEGTEVETQAQAEDQLFDEYGNPIEGEPEDEEIEIDPELKLKVPKDQAQKLRDAILRQADYTRKTQEVAELRRSVEAEAFQARQMDDQEISAKAQLNAISQRYNHLQSINFAAESNRINGLIAQAANNYDDDAQNHWRGELAGLDTLFKEFTQLGPQHQNLSNALARHQQQRTLAEQQKVAKLIEQGRAELSKAIPEWNDTLKAKLVDHAVKNGIDADELSDIEANPAAARILHDAFLWRSQATQQKKVADIAAVQAVKPAAKVGGGSPPPGKLDDRLSAEEWTRRRNEQVRKRA